MWIPYLIKNLFTFSSYVYWDKKLEKWIYEPSPPQITEHLDIYVMYCITSTVQSIVPNQILPPTGQSEGLSLTK